MTTKVLDTLLMPKLTLESKTFFGMSSILRMELTYTDSATRKKLSSFLNEPIFTLANLDKKYRSVNYLEKMGLIEDTRDQKGKGWRKLGLSEYIYVSILLELRKYGLKSNSLKSFKTIFDKHSAHSIYAVLSGHEVTMIFKPDGFCALLDPTFLGIYETEDPYFSEVTPRRNAGEIQLKLSYFVAKALSLIGKPTPTIHYSFAKNADLSQEMQRLKEYEKRLLGQINQLDPKNDERLLIRRLKDGEFLLSHSKAMPNTDLPLSNLSALVDEDFCNLNVVKRDGKVVRLEKTHTEKLSTA